MIPIQVDTLHVRCQKLFLWDFLDFEIKCVGKGELILCLFLYVVIQTPEELEDDSDFEQEDYDVRSRTSVQTEDDQLIAGQSARVRGH